MLRRLLVGLLLLAGAVLPAAPRAAAAAPACTYQLGFAALHDLLPARVGACADAAAHNPATGDALQHTATGGLLVWRKADNWTAFTDGYRTWVAGPYGLRYRLNGERFPWEADHARYAPAPAWPTQALVEPGEGYALDFPASWRADLVSPADPAKVIALVGPNGEKVEVVSGDVATVEGAGARTPEQVVAAYPAGTDVGGLCGPITGSWVVTIAGQRMARVDFARCRAVHAFMGDRAVIVEGYGDPLPFDPIAASLRLTGAPLPPP